MQFLGKNSGRQRRGGGVVPGGEILLWSDAILESRESRQLYFWRLSFAPRYPKEKIFKGLERFYSEVNITSYVVYETLGDYDLLLRVWAPRAYNAEELELQLRQSLQGCFLWNLNHLACKTELHFSDNGHQSGEPTPELAGDPLIDEINQYNQAQYERLLPPNEATGEPPKRPEGTSELIERGDLKAVSLDTRGIRLFITFDHPRQPLRPETRQWVVEQLKDKCRDVREYWEGETEVDSSGQTVPIRPPNISIYAGAGSMTDFFVMARAPHKHFHEFVQQLIHGLREIGLDEAFEMRPYTHVIADQMFSAFKEHRVVGAQVDDIPGLIQKDEDEGLEMKATLATNFRSLIVANRPDKDPLMLNEVVKTVCGFLNSPRGGTLILGVLEVRRELEKARDPESYMAALKDRFGYAPDEEEGTLKFPNAVVGIDVDIEAGHFSDSDEYVRYLGDVLDSHISPNPWPWLRVETQEIEGRRICLVWVRPGDVWFYARLTGAGPEEFFVRRGASTPSLSGSEADLYKRVYPRTPPFSTSQSERH